MRKLYEDGLVNGEDIEEVFPGCITRLPNGKCIADVETLAKNFIIVIKGSTSLTKEQFLQNIAEEWDAIAVSEVGNLN
jgi:hypothetical protein